MDEKKRNQRNQARSEEPAGRSANEQETQQDVSYEQDQDTQSEEGSEESFYRNRERGNMDERSDEGGGSLY